MRGSNGRWLPRWLGLAGVLLVAVVLSLTPSTVSLGKEFAVVGTIDCGRRSGQRCQLGDSIVLITNDVSGAPQRIVIDISWIRSKLPALDQDDLIGFEVQDGRSDGVLQAIGVIEHRGRDGHFNDGVNRSEQPKYDEEDDDVTATSTPTVTPTTTAIGTATVTPTPTASPTVTPTATVSTMSGLVYVANQVSGTVSVIRPSDHTVVATIPVGVTPFGVAVSPDGARVYVANINSNTVSVIRTADHTVVANIPVGAGPRGVTVSPDGSRVYVTNGFTNTVSVIRTSDNTVVATVTVGSQPGAWRLARMGRGPT